MYVYEWTFIYIVIFLLFIFLMYLMYLFDIFYVMEHNAWKSSFIREFECGFHFPFNFISFFNFSQYIITVYIYFSRIFSTWRNMSTQYGKRRLFHSNSQINTDCSWFLSCEICIYYEKCWMNIYININECCNYKWCCAIFSSCGLVYKIFKCIFFSNFLHIATLFFRDNTTHTPTVMPE